MENLKEIVELSYNFKNCLENLGININGTNYTKLKKLINEQNISTEHFKTPSKIMRELNGKYSTNEIFSNNSDFSRGCVKRNIIKNKLINYECIMCKNDGNWMGKKFSLILDHINGINNDNRIENLRFLCPNCNATLETHCGRNVKNIRNKKQPKTKEEIFELRKLKRTVTRPPLEILLHEIKELGYTGTGKKYGVSDKSIRKWVEIYKKYETPILPLY